MLADWRIRVLSQALPWPRIVTDTLHQWLSHTVIVCTIPYCLQIIRHYIILHPMIEAIFSFIHCFREAANPRQSMWVFIVFIVIVESKRWAEKLRRSDALCQHQTPPRLRLKFLEFSQTWPGIRYLLYWRNVARSRAVALFNAFEAKPIEIPQTRDNKITKVTKPCTESHFSFVGIVKFVSISSLFSA